MPKEFRADRLTRLSEIETRHFWFAGRRALLDRLRRKYLTGETRRLLDVGCGTGSEAERISAEGLAVVGVDSGSGLLGSARPARGRVPVVNGDAARLPCRGERFDAVLLLDVLEHVDDASALREARRVLSPGGFLFLSVPAFPGLWSYRDEDAGHRRRYTHASLARGLREARLEIREIGYYQCLLFPFVVISRLLGRRGPARRDAEDLPGFGVNALCGLVNRFEVALGALVRWPWGSSLVAVCQRS